MSGLPGFEKSFVEANGIRIAIHAGGSGPCLVLLHGFPQNHMCWSKIAPELSRGHRCIVPDLRGYGESDAPKDIAPYRGYSKRNMAADVAGLLDALGVEKASIVGHDRGARVAYRLALDFPHRVDRIAILEVVPTGELWRRWNAELAYNAYHWTFLAQPAPLPERMISSDPVSFIDWTLASWTLSKSLKPFPQAALASYRRQAEDPDRIAAMCCDYRSASGARLIPPPSGRPRPDRGNVLRLQSRSRDRPRNRRGGQESWPQDRRTLAFHLERVGISRAGRRPDGNLAPDVRTTDRRIDSRMRALRYGGKPA